MSRTLESGHEVSFNPLKYEKDAFRVLLYVLAVAAVVLIAALVIQAL